MRPASTSPSSKTDQVTDVAATTLEVSLGILSLIGDATENVPYLNTVTGCLKQLVDIRKAMKDNSNLAVELLDNIGDVACAVAKGLQELDTEQRNITLQGLREDLDAYETVLKDTRVIVEKWTSKHFIKRLLDRDGFPAIAATIERKIKGFHDAFTAKRLILLQKGQVQLDTKVQIAVDELTRTKLREWLKPAGVGRSQSDAANKRHPNTGNWFINGAELAEWINTPGAFVWLEGISGSGKTVLSSTTIETLRVRGVPKAFFYFDTNNREQQTVTQLLCSLVDQLSIQVNCPDRTLL
ncbi:hypothetical protein C8F01DRAFT_1177644 [Mycena amicta]|nr:hypothetical protein C8F01DRAFT_1177644 [Mycena amicta]